MNTPKVSRNASRSRNDADTPPPNPVDDDLDPEAESGDPAVEEQVSEAAPSYPQPTLEWKPTLDAPVTIGWKALDGDRFQVYVYVVLPDASAPGGSSSQRIVDAVVGQFRSQLPFSARTETSPFTFISGGFEWFPPSARQRLVVDELRYPGGYVRRHVLV